MVGAVAVLFPVRLSLMADVDFAELQGREARYALRIAESVWSSLMQVRHGVWRMGREF